MSTPDTSTNRESADLSSWTKHPHRLAVDAKGYVWRVYEDGVWSMAPQNPDNSPIPEPVVFYDANPVNRWERVKQVVLDAAKAHREADAL